MKRCFSRVVRIRTAVVLILALAFISSLPSVHSQVVNETTKKKVSLGFGMFTDLWLNVPKGIDMRGVNQGVNVFGLYNLPFGKSHVGFSIGLGLTVHNAFGDFIVDKSKYSDTTFLMRIHDSVDYKRSKMTLVYLTLPLEFNLKTPSHVNIALGFRGGLLISSHTKYVGDGRIKTSTYSFYTLEELRLKLRVIPNLAQFTYGPTFRLGYKWINFDVYYMISDIFNKNHGPEMSPISFGFVLMPF